METPSHDMGGGGRFEASAMIEVSSDEGLQWAGMPSDPAATETLLKSFAGALGYGFYLLATMPAERGIAFTDSIRLTNWPVEARESYGATSMFSDSLFVTRFRRSVLPVSGGNVMFGTAGKPADQARVSRLLGHYGIEATFAFTLHGPERSQYVFAFSKRGASPDVIGGDDSLSRGMKILDLLKSNEAPMPAVVPALSKRERECLEWCAAGKTADETAVIMNLSTHTVESYIRSAMKKLGAVNRMQAIAMAVRQSII